VIIFGHRGAPGYPRRGENTRASFKKALSCGAAGIEFDVRRCGDGRLVVIHDDTIDRTTAGRGRVRDFSYEDLRQFEIPLLTDVLDEFAPRCLLNIEMKDPGIASDVKKSVLERRLQQQVIVSSFEWEELPTLVPEIPIALLSSKSENLISQACALGASAIHPRRDIVTEELMAQAHNAKLRVHAWTVNDPAEMLRLNALAIDGIFTDFPELWPTLAS
jgi:glycerophosphoryl diester phosphodiesterase